MLKYFEKGEESRDYFSNHFFELPEIHERREPLTSTWMFKSYYFTRREKTHNSM